MNASSASPTTIPSSTSNRSVPRERINSRIRSLPPSGIRAFFDLVASRNDIISLGVGEPDFNTPWHITESGIHSLETGHTTYTSNSGMAELREEIVHYLKRVHKADYDAATEVLVTVGASEGIDLAFRSLIDPGDEVIVVDPSFVSYAPLAYTAGADVIRLATREQNGFVPTLDEIESSITPKTRAIIINYPNNPTGATLNFHQAEAIVGCVQRHNLFLISDEIYLPLTFDGASPSLAEFPEIHDQLILIHGFSKAWAMTGWRLGFAAGPPDVIEAMTKIHQYSLMCASTTAQHAAIEALRQGDEDIVLMRKEYDARRRYMAHHLNRIGLNTVIPHGAFYIFPGIQKTGMSSEEFAHKLLEEESVAVVPGSAFGECGEGYVRCSYATSMNELRQAIQRMERFVRAHSSE